MATRNLNPVNVDELLRERLIELFYRERSNEDDASLADSVIGLISPQGNCGASRGVLALLDALESGVPDVDLRGYREAYAAVAAQQDLIRRLVAWNHNINGDGRELGAICAAAEALVGRGEATGEPRHGAEQISAVCELVDECERLCKAAEGMKRNAEGMSRKSPVAITLKTAAENILSLRIHLVRVGDAT